MKKRFYQIFLDNECIQRNHELKLERFFPGIHSNFYESVKETSGLKGSKEMYEIYHTLYFRYHSFKILLNLSFN